MKTNKQHISCSGQAMTEFIVGLVAILALVAGLLQIASITNAHTRTMVEARREAGENAMMDLQIASDAKFIDDWEIGIDSNKYTADDRANEGDSSPIRYDIVDKTVANESDWELIDRAPNDLQQLQGAYNLSLIFGLVEGSGSESVELMPLLHSLQYRYPLDESVDLKCSVWMTWTKGIY